jgi:beta-lactamase regulating signal transducer with metallopeptidase domain
MDTLLNWVWQGGVVAVALWPLLRLLDRAGAQVRYVVCWAALVLVSVLPIVPSVLSPSPAWPVQASWAAEPVVSVPDVWWTSSALVMAAWAVWVGANAVRFIRAMVVLRRARARCLPFPAVVEALLPHWRRVRHEGRRPALVLSESVATAAVLGAGAPLIAVAPALVEALEPEELDRVLIHEWAHVQRHDDVVSVLQLVVRLAAGWHPAVWAIERRLHVEREIACDEAAVAITGSPKSYAACLVRLASLRGGERPPLAAPAVFAASGLRARVTRLVSRPRSLAPLWSYGLAAGIVSSLALVAASLGGVALVETAAFALPFESIRAPRTAVETAAPVRLPAAPPVAIARAPRPRVAATTIATPHIADHAEHVHLSSLAVAQAPVAQPAAGEPAPQVPEPNAERHSEPSVVSIAPAPAVASAGQPPPATAGPQRSPWQQAADGGVAIGRKSRDAGVATAGMFTRIAKRVAGSF